VNRAAMLNGVLTNQGDSKLAAQPKADMADREHEYPVIALRIG